nr:50S ribosomal protein L21 [Candidatus Levybacteria bacterium]
MKYAVIKTGGKQYKVSESDVIDVERLKSEKDEKVVFNEVLLLVSDDNIKIGKPFITGEKVEGKLLENVKGDKLRVSKFKAKVRYRKTIGFRASISRVQIDKISGTKEKEAILAKEKTTVKKTAKKKS